MDSSANKIPPIAKWVPVPNPAKLLIRPSKLMPVEMIRIAVAITEIMTPTIAADREPSTEAVKTITPTTNNIAAMEIWFRAEMLMEMECPEIVAIEVDSRLPKLALMGIWPPIQAKLLLHRSIRPAVMSIRRRLAFM